MRLVKELVMMNYWKNTQDWKTVESLSIYSDFQPRQETFYYGLLFVGDTPIYVGYVDVFNGQERKEYYPALKGREEMVLVKTTFFPRSGHADYGSEILISKEEFQTRVRNVLKSKRVNV
jgi:hypothetical protein